jgi:hypothetical protein
MTGPDCFGADSDTRSRKTVERREIRREFDRWLPHAADRLDPLDDPSDCQHSCNGDCERWGSEVCTWLCHPADLAERVVAWAERTGHCDPAGEPDLELVQAHLDRWAASVAATRPTKSQ